MSFLHLFVFSICLTPLKGCAILICMPLGKHASKQQIFLNSTLKKNPYSDTKRATQKA